jgi:hypothetical protein
MNWTNEDAQRAEDNERRFLLALYAEGKYLDLCEHYCHEGWTYHLNDAGALIEAGICSFLVTQGTEEEALAVVAAHIREELLAGACGC